MEIMQVLHMNKGDGDTSYVKNSVIQRKIISKGKHVIEEALLKMLTVNGLPQSMGIADLGCSSGTNSLPVISEIVDVVNAKCLELNCQPPELRIFLNDLPSNDFNYVFGLLPEFYGKVTAADGGSGPCFVSATPGTFYGRLFPSRSLHFVHSSSSLHWLSQVGRLKVPPGLCSNGSDMVNRGKIYISKSSPESVLDAYSSQFQEDFSMFLRSRSQEMVAGGRMVMSFMGRRSVDPTDERCYQWELLAQALSTMVSEGLIEEGKIDGFNLPYYDPCPEELKTVIQREGSFTVDHLEAFQIDWHGGAIADDEDSSDFAVMPRGKRVAMTIRAVVESMLEVQFGRGIMDGLFERYGVLVDDYLADTNFTNLVISLVRNDS